MVLDHQETVIFRKAMAKLKRVPGYFLFTFHLCRNNYPYLRHWVKRYPTIGVISIPYSENPDVKKEINSLTTVYSPPLKLIPKTIVDICKSNSRKKILLVEIGGYSALVCTKLHNVILAAEDTNQGHWRFKQREKYLTYPVVSIAQTRLKALENELIGCSIVYSVETLIRKHFNLDYIVGKRVLVISYGGIGSAVCRALAAHRARVRVYDRDASKLVQAYIDGFTVTQRYESLSWADIIIGCTGSTALSISDIALLKPKTLLVSGSSKQVEFPYRQIQKYITNKDKEVEMLKIKGKKIF